MRKRMAYEKLLGDGPSYGWISIEIDGICCLKAFDSHHDGASIGYAIGVGEQREQVRRGCPHKRSETLAFASIDSKASEFWNPGIRDPSSANGS